MRKISLHIALCTLFACVCSVAFAQVPSKMNYQAVVRDANGNLQIEKPIGIRVAILNSNETEVFAETHRIETNENGLLTIEIGEGEQISGVLADIDWANDSYSVVIGVDITGGNSYDIELVQPLVTVPYAFCAKTVETIDYSKLTNVPTKLSEFDNDANLVTKESLDSAIATVVVPTKMSDLENDANYVNADTLAVYATKEDLGKIDLSDYAKVADLPSKLSDLENDANLISKTEMDSALATVVIPTKMSELDNDTNYVNADTLALYATKEDLEKIDLSDYAKVAELPTKLSDLENDANLISKSEMDSALATVVVPTKVSELENDGVYATVDTLAVYATKAELENIDLSEYLKIEDLPIIPSKVSDLENDLKFVREKDIDGMVLDILHAAFRDPETRDAIIEDILSDTAAMKKYGAELVDMVLSDKDYVTTLGKKFYDFLTNDPEYMKSIITKVITKVTSDKETMKSYASMMIDVLRENKELVLGYAEDLMNNATFRHYVKAAIQKYVNESTISSVINAVGKEKIVKMIKDLGIVESVSADIQSEIENTVNEVKTDITTTIESKITTAKSEISTTIDEKIAEALASMNVQLVSAEITSSSASSNSITITTSVTKSESVSVYSQGVCYGTTYLLPVEGTYYKGTGTMTISGLAAGTYYVCPFVYSNKGMYYGEVKQVVVE